MNVNPSLILTANPKFPAIPLRHRSDRATHHQLFIAEHTKKRPDADLPAGKTLFVLNVPPYVHAEHLSLGFTDAAGEVSHVVMADRRGVRLTPPAIAATDAASNQAVHEQFKSAYVVFRSTKALRNALTDAAEIRLYRNNKTFVETGLAQWTREYMAALPDERSIQSEVDKYMEVFERTEEQQRIAERQATADVDEEGWQTVGGGRGAGFEQKESTLQRLTEKMDEGKKKKELQNFYTFQIRDSKKQHVVGLRKRFEDDKRKIETMKKARHFRPY